MIKLSPQCDSALDFSAAKGDANLPLNQFRANFPPSRFPDSHLNPHHNSLLQLSPLTNPASLRPIHQTASPQNHNAIISSAPTKDPTMYSPRATAPNNVKYRLEKKFINANVPVRTNTSKVKGIECTGTTVVRSIGCLKGMGVVCLWRN